MFDIDCAIGFIEVAKAAYQGGKTLKETAVEMGLLTPEQFDQWVRPENMVSPA